MGLQETTDASNLTTGKPPSAKHEQIFHRIVAVLRRCTDFMMRSSASLPRHVKSSLSLLRSVI